MHSNRTAFQAKFGKILEKLNFVKETEASRIHINDFIAEATRGQITDCLSPTDVPPGTNLVIANAAYFHGDWKAVFDPKLTQAKPFNGLNGKRDVQMMQRKDGFKARTLKALNADIVELPYKGDVSMFIVVPEKQNQTQAEFDAFVEALTNTPMKQLTQGLYNMVITVEMPKINLEESYTLGQVDTRYILWSFWWNSKAFTLWSSILLMSST